MPSFFPTDIFSGPGDGVRGTPALVFNGGLACFHIIHDVGKSFNQVRFRFIHTNPIGRIEHNRQLGNSSRRAGWRADAGRDVLGGSRLGFFDLAYCIMPNHQRSDDSQDDHRSLGRVKSFPRQAMHFFFSFVRCLVLGFLGT